MQLKLFLLVFNNCSMFKDIHTGWLKMLQNHADATDESIDEDACTLCTLLALKLRTADQIKVWKCILRFLFIICICSVVVFSGIH